MRIVHCGAKLQLIHVSTKGAITNKIKHAIKLKTSPARLQCAVIG